MGYGIKPSWVCYETRTVGVNLAYKDNPCYQWQLLGGTPGQPVKVDEWLAIYNTKAKECFIYFERTVGGHVDGRAARRGASSSRTSSAISPARPSKWPSKRQ